MTTTQAKQLLNMSRRMFHQAYRHRLTRENRELMANMREQITILGAIVEAKESRENAAMERFSCWAKEAATR